MRLWTFDSMSGSEAGGQRGRPRDPEIDLKILEAALSVYQRHGWSGFTFQAVTASAGVGKGAVYRRWGSREALLLEALDYAIKPLKTIDEGSLREDLLVYTRHVFDHHFDEFGPLMLRIYVEGPLYPELFKQFLERVAASRVRAAKLLVLRGIKRGEIPATTSPTLLLDLIVGAIISQSLSTPPQRMDQVRRNRQRFVEDVVDLVIEGARQMHGGAVEVGDTGARGIRRATATG